MANPLPARLIGSQLRESSTEERKRGGGTPRSDGETPETKRGLTVYLASGSREIDADAINWRLALTRQLLEKRLT